MAFRTGTPQWMKLSNLNIKKKERRMKEEQELVRITKLKKEKMRKALQKRRRPIGYWVNINGWRFIKWSEQDKKV